MEQNTDSSQEAAITSIVANTGSGATSDGDSKDEPHISDDCDICGGPRGMCPCSYPQ